MSKWLTLVRRYRVPQAVIAGTSAWIGAQLTWLVPDYYAATAAVLAVLLTRLGVGVVEAGRERRREARWQSAWMPKRRNRLLSAYSLPAMALAALSAALYVSWLMLVAVAVLALLYGLRLHPDARSTATAVVADGVLAGAPFVAGGIAIDHSLVLMLPGPAIPTVLALLLGMTGSILTQSAHDAAGDAESRGQSLIPIALGLMVVAVILALVPVHFGWFGHRYGVLAIYAGGLPLLGLMILVWGNPTQRMLTIGQYAVNLVAVVGLAALLQG